MQLARAPHACIPETTLTLNNKKKIMTFVDCRRFTTNNSDFSRQTSETESIRVTPKKNNSRANNACRSIYQRVKFIRAIELCARIRKCRLGGNFVCAGIITSRIWYRCLRRSCKTINWWMWHYWPRTMRFMPIKSCCLLAVHTFRWGTGILAVIAIAPIISIFAIKNIIYSAIAVALHTQPMQTSSNYFGWRQVYLLEKFGRIHVQRWD